MPPQQTAVEHISSTENENIYHNDISEPKKKQTGTPIVKAQVVYFSIIQMFAFYGLYLVFSRAKLATTLFAILTYNLGMLGTTAGGHRLWSHRSYKATWQLKSILVLFQTLAYQRSIISWVRDHRAHHKYSETDADPHNASRGFFFSHIGWLLCKRHPELREKGKTIDLSDLRDDPLLRFQDKYFTILVVTICFLIPTIIPMFLWGETFVNAFFINVLRQNATLHATFLVNSAAHLWGSKPYDRSIYPAENRFVSIFTLGEGWHNYHHAFPWDYKTSEFGAINMTLRGINLFAKIGWAYDLKTVSNEMIQHRINRTGDGSYKF